MAKLSERENYRDFLFRSDKNITSNNSITDYILDEII